MVELRPELREPRDIPEDRALRQGMREARERQVEPCNRGADRATGGRGEGAGRERRAVDQADELDCVVDAADLDRARRPTIDRPPRPGNRKRRIRPEGVLHREHLHLDDVCRVGRIADLEDERAVGSVDPEVAVSLAVERRRFAVDAEHGSSDVDGERCRDFRRARFEDVVAHGAPR